MVIIMNYKDFFEIEHPILQATMTHNGDWKLQLLYQKLVALVLLRLMEDIVLIGWMNK